MKNKIVLITGATSGIGKACALYFAKKNFIVLLHGSSQKSDFSVLKEIKQKGGKAYPLVADFLKEKEIEKMFVKIKQENKKIDVLINNAGMVNRKNAFDLKSEDFQKLFMVNVTAPFLCAKQAKNLGATSIVNIGSMRGFPSGATTIDYSASKAALHNLTVSLARAFAPSCRVNCIAPGFTKTPLHDSSPERLKIESTKTPLLKYALPEEIAQSVYFLSSEKSSFTTGAVLLIDGGRSFA